MCLSRRMKRVKIKCCVKDGTECYTSVKERTSLGGWDKETGCLNKEPMIKKLAGAAENDATD